MDRVTLIALVVLGIVFLWLFVVVNLNLAPVVTSCLLVLTAASFAYIATERWLLTHAAQEFENRFWSLIAFLALCSLAFAPDSPVTLGLENAWCVSLSWFVVIGLTFLAHNLDRYLLRQKLKRLPKLMRRNMSAEFGQETKLAAREKLAKLHELGACIDQLWFSSAFLNLFWLANVLLVEKQIIDIFRELDAKQLNYILADFPIAHLFYKVKDHWLVRDFHRTQLLELLTVERLSVLTVKSRVMLLHGLQLKKLSATVKSETYAKNILLKTREDQLSELKCLMDSKGDFNSMHKLLFNDIRSPSIRQEILQHFAKQAAVQNAHALMGSKQGRRRRQLYAWRKIVCDVDDTLTCSGGSFPAGIDASYPKKELYPGVVGFLRELDLGTTTSKISQTLSNTTANRMVAVKDRDEDRDRDGIDYVWEDDRLSNLVLLSARPHVYSDVSEQFTYDKFDNLRKTRGLHGNPTLLAGALDTGTKFILANSMEPLAATKFQNYCEFSSIYPEFKYVFIGDNGQGDVRVGEMLLGAEADSPLRSSLERIYIHEVQPLHKTHVLDKRLLEPGPASKHICYFRTYVDAAVDALQHGLIKASGLKNVIAEAKRDFGQISREAWSHLGRRGRGGGGRLRDERLRELNRSIYQANKALLAANLSPASLISFSARFGRGSVVRCPYGLGIVDRFHPATGFYDVLLPTGVKYPPTTSSSEPSTAPCPEPGPGPRSTAGAAAALPAARSAKDHLRPPPRCPEISFMHVHVQGLVLHSWRGATINNNGRGDNQLQSLVYLPAAESGGRVQARALAPIASVSASVLLGYVAWTSYGVAVITGVRPREGAVECLTAWGGRCFLQLGKVVLLYAAKPTPSVSAHRTSGGRAAVTARAGTASDGSPLLKSLMSTKQFGLLTASDRAATAAAAPSSSSAGSGSGPSFPIYSWFFRKDTAGAANKTSGSGAPLQALPSISAISVKASAPSAALSQSQAASGHQCEAVRGLLAGTRVQTPFGEAVIMRFVDRGRALVIQVRFVRWVAVGYLQPDIISVLQGSGAATASASASALPLPAAIGEVTTLNAEMPADGSSSTLPNIGGTTIGTGTEPNSSGSRSSDTSSSLMYLLGLITPGFVAGPASDRDAAGGTVATGVAAAPSTDSLDEVPASTHSGTAAAAALSSGDPTSAVNTVVRRLGSHTASQLEEAGRSPEAAMAFATHSTPGAVRGGDVELAAGYGAEQLQVDFLQSCAAASARSTRPWGYSAGDFVICPPFGECEVQAVRIDSYVERTKESASAGAPTEAASVTSVVARVVLQLRKVPEEGRPQCTLVVFAGRDNVCTCVRAWPGQTVDTLFGPAVVLEVRPCGIHVVRSAAVSSMTMYLHPRCIKLSK